MRVERFEVPGLAQYSYVISDSGRAVLIDAMRDVDRYLKYAKDNGITFGYILETHIHADFAAGSTALAKATGAELALSGYDQGERFCYAMPHRRLRDGDLVEAGAIRLEALHTPGHTPEHLSFLLFDTSRSAEEPVALFSGDFLFVGALGRPELLGEEAKIALAHELSRSVRERIAALPDGLEVFPGHGAGSLCGAGMGESPETTLGYERATNPFFRYAEAEFVEKILASVPPMPAYYPRMKELNAKGAAILDGVPGAEALPVSRVCELRLRGLDGGRGVVIVDLRSPEAFGAAHIEGALNIGAGASLSLWAGWLLEPGQEVVLVSDGEDDEEARRGFIRVGLDRVVGHLAGGMRAWTAAGLPVARTGQKSAAELSRERHRPVILDVRSDEEVSHGRIPGSRHIMLGDLPNALASLEKSEGVVTVCASGYRASIAASLLERAGFEHVSVLQGGVEAWTKEGLPVVK